MVTVRVSDGLKIKDIIKYFHVLKWLSTIRVCAGATFYNGERVSDGLKIKDIIQIFSYFIMMIYNRSVCELMQYFTTVTVRVSDGWTPLVGEQEREEVIVITRILIGMMMVLLMITSDNHVDCDDEVVVVEKKNLRYCTNIFMFYNDYLQ